MIQLRYHCQGVACGELFAWLLTECVCHDRSLVSLFNECCETKASDAWSGLSLPPQVVREMTTRGWSQKWEAYKIDFDAFYFYCMSCPPLTAFPTHLNELGIYQ
jgi:hypothetical protein